MIVLFLIFYQRDDYDDWSKAPEGIYCQRPDIFRRRLPELPEQFSVAIESVDEVRATIPQLYLYNQL